MTLWKLVRSDGSEVYSKYNGGIEWAEENSKMNQLNGWFSIFEGRRHHDELYVVNGRVEIWALGDMNKKENRMFGLRDYGDVEIEPTTKEECLRLLKLRSFK